MRSFDRNISRSNLLSGVTPCDFQIKKHICACKRNHECKDFFALTKSTLYFPIVINLLFVLVFVPHHKTKNFVYKLTDGMDTHFINVVSRISLGLLYCL